MYTNNMNSINDYEDNYKIVMHKCVCICSLNIFIFMQGTPSNIIQAIYFKKTSK